MAAGLPYEVEMRRDPGLIERSTDLHGNGQHRVGVLGCPVDTLDMSETLARCIELIGDPLPRRQVSVNAAKLLQCASDEKMAAFVAESDLVSADGQSVVWASRFLGRPLPERVAGIDLMLVLLRECEERGLSVYLLGAERQVLRGAMARIREWHPRLRIAGAHHGYFGTEGEDDVVSKIRSASPDVLFVAIGSPRKEEFVDRRFDELGAGFAMGVGGALDVIAGERARAPRWAQRAGLEWAARMIQEPRRLWRRYLIGNLRFIWLVLRERFTGRPAIRGTSD